MMFEKAKSFPVRSDASASGYLAEGDEERFGTGRARRAGDALRAMEWSELTARLNAARDLRLLLRTESHAPIEAIAASFGDAAASYFALLEDSEPDFNPDPLAQLKGPGAMIGGSDANRPDDAAGSRSAADRGDARDMR